MQLEGLVDDSPAIVAQLLNWAETGISFDSAEIEAKVASLGNGTLRNISHEEARAFEKWKQHPALTLDHLTLRHTECHMLWIVACYHINHLLCQAASAENDLASFTAPPPADLQRLLQVLGDLAEAAGLVKSLLGNPALDDLMDTMDDQDGLALSIEPPRPKSAFELYLFSDRWRRIPNYHQIIDTIADRCGVGTDDLEQEALSARHAHADAEPRAASQNSAKTRRITPLSLPPRPIPPAAPRHQSSLSQDAAPANGPKLLGRQVELTLHAPSAARPGPRPTNQQQAMPARPQADPAIITASTPPKRRDSTAAPAPPRTENLVILETPPKAQHTSSISMAELKPCARRLFPQ